jgi:tellurite resistance protein
MSVTNGFHFPRVPAAFLGIVLGVVGLANSWRAATQVWQLPAAVGETLAFAAWRAGPAPKPA